MSACEHERKARGSDLFSRRSHLLPGEPAGADTIADQVAPESQVACKFPGFDTQRLQRCNQTASQSLYPQLIGPDLNQCRILVPVQEDAAHGMQVTQKASYMGCLFIPVSKDETGAIHLRLGRWRDRYGLLLLRLRPGQIGRM